MGTPTLFLQFRRKVRILKTPTDMRITIPYSHGLIAPVFLGFWLLMNLRMAFVLSGAIPGSVTRTKFHRSLGFMVLGLLILLWELLACEVLTISLSQFVLRRGEWAISWSRSYPLKRIENVRAGFYLDPRARGYLHDDNITAALFFNYENKAHRFGNELTLKDALRIEAEVRELFPTIVVNRG